MEQAPSLCVGDPVGRKRGFGSSGIAAAAVASEDRDRRFGSRSGEERVRHPARPERVPDPIDLAADFTRDHALTAQNCAPTSGNCTLFAKVAFRHDAGQPKKVRGFRVFRYREQTSQSAITLLNADRRVTPVSSNHRFVTVSAMLSQSGPKQPSTCQPIPKYSIAAASCPGEP